MTDTFGPTSSAPFAFYDPDSSSLKTSQGTFLSDSTESSMILPPSGSMRSGALYARPMSERVTAEPGCSSLLPTPVANDDHKTAEAHLAAKVRSGAGESITSLDVMARQAAGGGMWSNRLLPTPRTSDSNGGGTTETEDSTYAPSSGNLNDTTLTVSSSDQSPMYPPQASSSRSCAALAISSGETNSGCSTVMETVEVVMPTDHPLPAKSVKVFLPTPRASDRENRSTKRTPTQIAGRHGLYLASEAASISRGEPTAPRYAGTSEHSDDQLPLPLTTKDG